MELDWEDYTPNAEWMREVAMPSDFVREYFTPARMERISELFDVEADPEPEACGAFGCVYLTDGPQAIKIGADPREGNTWARLREIQESRPELVPAIPHITSIIRIRTQVEPPRWRGKAVSVFAVLREDVRELERSDLGSWDDYTELSRILEAYAGYAHQAHLRMLSDEDPAGELGDASYVAQMLARKYPELGRTLMTMADEEIAPSDLNMGNIGFREEDIWGRPGTVMLIDPGDTQSVGVVLEEKLVANDRRAGG